MGIGDSNQLAGRRAVLFIHQLMDNALAALVKMHAEFLGKIVHGPNAVAGLFRRSRIDMIHNENHTIRIKHLADADFTEHLNRDWSGHIVGGHIADLAGKIVPRVRFGNAGSLRQICFDDIHRVSIHSVS